MDEEGAIDYYGLFRDAAGRSPSQGDLESIARETPVAGIEIKLGRKDFNDTINDMCDGDAKFAYEAVRRISEKGGKPKGTMWYIASFIFAMIVIIGGGSYLGAHNNEIDKERLNATKWLAENHLVEKVVILGLEHEPDSWHYQGEVLSHKYRPIRLDLSNTRVRVTEPFSMVLTLGESLKIRAALIQHTVDRMTR